jgi:Bacterial protein of unknown function (DUF885)
MNLPALKARLAAGCLTVALAVSAAAAPMKWDALVNDYLDGYFALNPATGVAQGRHEFDGQLPDWSEAGLTKKIAWLQAERSAAEAFPAEALDARQRFERDYLVAQIRGDLFWLTTADSPHRNPAFYGDAIDPDVYVSRPYAPLADRLAAYSKYARSVPVAVAQIKENLKGPLAKPLAAIGRVAIGGMADFYEQDVPKVFARELTGAKKVEFEEANAAAIKAVREFSAWISEREKTATADFALGADKFRAMLRETEGVDLPLGELEAIGRKDMERNLAAMKEACAAFAPGKTVEEAIKLAWAHKPAGGVVPYARQQLTELEQFVRAKNLVSVPGTEKALVDQAPAYKSWNFAYINIPGPYEHDLPSVYYVAPPDPAWPKQQQDDYVPSVGYLLATSAHEVWPGHFLQFLHANRAPSKFGQVFVGYAYAEGWAHYTEEMMWEAGLGEGSPELHIGQLMQALLRNVRFMSAIGLHTKGMTVEESIKLFREKAYADAGNAEQQARRGTFDPGYLNYTMGKLMIRKLRADWTATRGGRKAWHDFHDAFLQYGGPPIPFVRRAMLGDADKGPLF